MTIGVNTQTNKIYVANYGTSPDPDSTITVIDGSSDTVLRTLTVEANPYFVAVNETTNKIYVTQYGFGGNSLTVIDGASDTTLNLPLAHAQPEQVMVNPLTNKVYITHVDGYISVLDGATNELTYVNNGTRMSGVALNTQTNEFYFANYFLTAYGNSGGGSTVSKLDGATLSITRLQVGTSPVGVAVDPVRNIVLVSNYDSSSVTLLDGATGAYLGESYVAANPMDIKVNPVTGEAYVATADYVWVLFRENYLSKWSLYSNNHPGSIGLDTNSGFVYIGLPSANQVAVVTPCVPL
jgi:DNA-binding beta-propeller fold protein YncE